MGNNWCDDVGAVECRWTIKYGFCCDTNDDDVIVLLLLYDVTMIDFGKCH